MKIIVDSFGEKVKPWETVQGCDGAWYTVTDLVPEDPRFQVGAVFEGGDPEEDGDYFEASFFFCEVVDPDEKAEQLHADPSGWRQEAFSLWCE